MAMVYRDGLTDEVVVRLKLDMMETNPRGIAEQLQERIMGFLAEEFLKKYKDGILGALNADDIAYKLNDAVAELVRRKLLEGTNESAT